MFSNAATYDEIAYHGALTPYTTISHVLLCYLWSGGLFTSRESSRIIELGCGDGANVIPMAFYQHNSSFIGIDYAPHELSRAMVVAKKLRLQNITFLLNDVSENGLQNLPKSDGIVAHGLYSWVACEIRDAVLAFCSKNLKPNGLAYISYNAQPGWGIRGLVRDLLLRAPAVNAAPTTQKAQRAKKVAKQLLEDLPSLEYAYAFQLAEELQRVVDGKDFYIFHEYLEEHNEGFWLSDFVERARSHGLEYVCDAQFCRWEGHVPAEIREKLATRGLGQVEQEEAADVLCNRFFHASILCRADAPRSTLTHREIVDRVHIATSIEALSEPFQLDDGIVERFEGRGGAEVTIDMALTKAVVLLLANMWPLGMRFEEVYAKAVAFLEQHGFQADAKKKEVLADELIRLFESGQVDFRLQENQNVVETLQDYPNAHALARYEAEHREALTTPYHIPVLFEPEEMEIIRAADGSKPLDTLRAEFGRELTDRTLLVAGRCGLLQVD